MDINSWKSVQKTGDNSEKVPSIAQSHPSKKHQVHFSTSGASHRIQDQIACQCMQKPFGQMLFHFPHPFILKMTQ